MKGLSLRAPADVHFVPRNSLDSTDHNDRVGSNYDSNPKSKANSWFMSGIHQLFTMLRGWLLSSDEYFNDVIRVDEHLAYSKNTKNATHYLPPTLQIETIEFSFRSWSRPVVSVQMRGATVNVVIQKGAIPIQLPLSVLGHGKQGDADLACQVDNSVEESADAAISIGDMTIHEVLKLLPKPPEEEGLYPRIGVVNITNVTLAIYSKPASAFSKSVTSDDDIGDSRSSSKLLTKVNIPDELFFPVANLTVGEYHDELPIISNKCIFLSLTVFWIQHTFSCTKQQIRQPASTKCTSSPFLNLPSQMPFDIIFSMMPKRHFERVGQKPLNLQKV